MKKVLHFLGSSAYGGGSSVSRDISIITQEIGFETYFFTNDKKTQDKLIESDINIVYSKKGKSIFQTMITLYRFLKDNDIDIIHTHTTVWGYVGRFVAKLASTKTIIHHVHNLYYYMPNNIVIQKFAYMVEAIFSKYFSDILIFIEREKYEDFKIKTKAKKLYIPNGIDNKRYIIKTRENIDSKINIGFLGRLEKTKGLDKLLDLFSEKQFSKKYNFIIAGDGTLRGLVEKVQLNNEDIIYQGFLDNIEEFFNNIDIMILPTKYEGLSMSILESLAYAKPVITTDIPGNRYLIYHNKNGFLYPSEDYTYLGEILNVLTIKQCYDMGSFSKSIALEYDISKFSYSIEKLYQKLLKELSV